LIHFLLFAPVQPGCPGGGAEPDLLSRSRRRPSRAPKKGREKNASHGREVSEDLEIKPVGCPWHAHGLTDLLVAVHALALPIITGAIIAVIKIARLHQLSFLELISQSNLK